MGDYIYLFSMMLIGIALGIFMLWRQLKQKNAKYEADLARFNTQSESPVAALDEAGRPISPETLIRSFRSSQLLDGWLTVALAGFGLFSSVVLVLHATDHFGGERLSQVRGQFIFLAVACLSFVYTL